MKSLAPIGLAFLVTGCTTPSGRQDDVHDYLQAKARYETLYRDRYDSLARIGIAGALKDLESRMRAILGPDSLAGWRQSFNLKWLASEEDGARVLDGMYRSDSVSHTEMVVTSPGILKAWLIRVGDSTADPLVGLSRDDVLTWVFFSNAHVYSYADLRTPEFPPAVFLASLVARTNGDPQHPDEVIVGVSTGKRIYVIIAPAVVMFDFTAQCGEAWRAGYAPCFKRLLPGHTDYSRLVAQVRTLATLAGSFSAGSSSGMADTAQARAFVKGFYKWYVSGSGDGAALADVLKRDTLLHPSLLALLKDDHEYLLAKPETDERDQQAHEHRHQRADDQPGLLPKRGFEIAAINSRIELRRQNGDLRVDVRKAKVHF
jgi:hypothetical protein